MDFSKIGALGSKDDPMAKKPKFDELGKDPFADEGKGDLAEIKSKIDTASPEQLEQIKKILGIGGGEVSKGGLGTTEPEGGAGGLGGLGL